MEETYHIAQVGFHWYQFYPVRGMGTSRPIFFCFRNQIVQLITTDEVPISLFILKPKLESHG